MQDIGKESLQSLIPYALSHRQVPGMSSQVVARAQSFERSHDGYCESSHVALSTHGSDIYCRCIDLEDHASTAHVRTASATQVIRRPSVHGLSTKNA